MSDDLDFDALERKLAKRPKSAPKPPNEDVDFDVLEAALENQRAIDAEEEARRAVTAIPPKDPAALQRKIDAGMSPLPGGIRTLADAFRESNQAVGQRLADGTLLGAPGQALRAAGMFGAPVQPIPEPGRGAARKPEDYLPTEETLTSVPAAAVDMATMGGAFGRAGQTIARAPGAIARGLGASEAQAAVRPGLQVAAESAGAGGLYSGADTAMRGGTPSEVLASVPLGVAGGVGMSQLPAAAGAIERSLGRRVAANDLRPVKQMAKKGTLDKELIQFGNGNPEEGAKEMIAFVQRENLGPVLRQKGQKAVQEFEARKNEVWERDLKPIYEYAKKAEPDAAVSFDEIAATLRAGIAKRGGNEHRLVEKAIDEIKARTELVGKNGVVPLDSLLTNARDFQSAGHAGVVNYDAPPESKVVMRQVGGALRRMANERVARIYERHPEAAQELFTGQARSPMGVTFRDQPSTPSMVRAGEYPNAWARRYENAQEYAADVPRLLAEGNKRFSDYAKLEPLVRQASTLKAGEKKWGLINLLGHGMTGTAGGLMGYWAGGLPGAVAGTAAIEGAMAGAPRVLRGGRGLASQLAGPAVPSGIAGALGVQPLEERRD
jgi:hypothetical protein